MAKAKKAKKLEVVSEVELEMVQKSSSTRMVQ